MKLKFKEDLDYQLEAIASVVNVFEGQSIAQDNFTVVAPSKQMSMQEAEYGDLGIGNRLSLLPEEINANLKGIQLQNLLPVTATKSRPLNLTIEMETGTGKTYVYLRTIFELHKKYGLTKFIIVVPSIPIKEGVHSSLKLMEGHFRRLYKNQPFNYFVYNSDKPEDVRAFATSSDIEIMIMNIQSFIKNFNDREKEDKSNKIYRSQDRLSGYAPIEFIRQTNPFVIIDEPQSVDNTAKSADAIQSLNPSVILRYSATHKKKLNVVYKLDAKDAYEKELVKQIEVISVLPKDSNNQAYIRLTGITNGKAGISAKIELDVLERGKINRKTKTVKKGTDLEQVTNRPDLYAGFIVDEINVIDGYISFTNNDVVIYKGNAHGAFDEEVLKREQIRSTIREHLDKQLRLRKEGIKVLSLFFIDKVKNYRDYQDGIPVKGKYARWFEEDFKELAKKHKYRSLFAGQDIEQLAEDIHNGYFSADKGILKDTTGKTKADESAYELIMKDKERLLSFDTKLSFIFSHSALKEGWDNPNVFQICTLNETKSDDKKRQEIGRGLRLCVNQSGDRIYGHDTNVLSVVVNESYETFVANLQTEIEKDTDITFGIIEKYIFKDLVIKNAQGKQEATGSEVSGKIYEVLVEQSYVDKNGKIAESLKDDLKFGRFELPEALKVYENVVIQKLRDMIGDMSHIKDGNKKVTVRLKKNVLLDPEFQKLWERINKKTSYSVNFCTKELIKTAIKAMQEDLKIRATKIEVTKADVVMEDRGITGSKTYGNFVEAKEEVELPDILTYLQNETNLTRKTLSKILIESGQLHLFKLNPAMFMQEVGLIIKKTLNNFVMEGIKYEKIAGAEYAVQEIFDKEELTGYLYEANAKDSNVVESTRSPYDYVVYDSKPERNFALDMEKDNRVKFYAKLPSKFKIETPIGNYNPDWAVLIENDGDEKLYFVVETKSTHIKSELSQSEQYKIECGIKHFEALNEDIKMMAPVHTFDYFLQEISS